MATRRNLKKRQMVFSVWVPLGLGMLIWLIAFLIGNWAVASLIAGFFEFLYMICLSTWDMSKDGDYEKVFAPWTILSVGLIMILLAVYGLATGIIRVDANNIRFENLQNLFIENIENEKVDKVGTLDVSYAETAVVETAGQVVINGDLIIDRQSPAETTVPHEIAESEVSSITSDTTKEWKDPWKDLEEEEEVEEEPFFTTTASTSKKVVTTKVTTKRTTQPYYYYEPVPQVVTSRDDTTVTPKETHSHSYGAWKYNSSKHWKECSCGKISSSGSHNFYVANRVESTCSTKGYVLYRCDCGYEKKENLALTSHSYDSGRITTEATCTKSGIRIYTCVYCSKTKTESIPASGNHKWGSWVTTTEATCSTDGVQQRKCSVCGKTETQKVAASGSHSPSYTWSHDDYKHWKECSKCHKHLEEASHSFGEWQTIQEATEYSAGTKVQRCSQCGYEKKENIPMLERKTLGQLSLTFGEGSYSMGGEIKVTIRYSGVSSLSNLKIQMAGRNLVYGSDYYLVYETSGAAIYAINVEVGSSGMYNLVVSADGCESATGYIEILQ